MLAVLRWPWASQGAGPGGSGALPWVIVCPSLRLKDLRLPPWGPPGDPYRLPHISGPQAPCAGQTIPQLPRRTRNSRPGPSLRHCPRSPPKPSFSGSQVLSTRLAPTRLRQRCQASLSQFHTPLHTLPGPWRGRTAVLREPDAPKSKFLVFAVTPIPCRSCRVSLDVSPGR